jgi:DNA-binding GntR family transcriptional regulator
MYARSPELFDRPSLGEDAASHLAGEIIRHRLLPGTKLVETDLCARHGISRSPLREALRLLEHWSLVQRRPRYGVHVAPMSVSHLDDLVTCRMALEARAAALVAGLPGRAGVAANLQAHLEAMRRAVAARDIEGCFTANLRMMDALHAANPNPVLARLLNELNLPAQRYRYLVYRYAPEVRAGLVAANMQLVEAIEDGDAARALALTEAMIDASWRHLRDRLSGFLDQAAADAAA